MLYKLITDINTLQDHTIDTPFAFELNSNYSQYLGYCKTFLRTSGGSPLPNAFIPAKLEEINPILH